MKIAVYGGSFNPPHIGHEDAARAASRALSPDKFLFITTADPPHKTLTPDSPSGDVRVALSRLAFSALPGAEVSDMEVRAGGLSYTSNTLETLHRQYPGAEFWFLMGTDMFLTLEQWHEFRTVLALTGIIVMSRKEDPLPEVLAYAEHLRREYGAVIRYEPKPIIDVSSTMVRQALREGGGRELVSEGVYAEIIRRRLYDARPELAWLREQAYAMLKPKRIPHVQGCEQEAVRLAQRWGADARDAAEGAILHDCTKKLGLEDQLQLCEKYGILTDELEQKSEKLLHSHTGAAIARDRFGVSDAVYSAIWNHTTGCADMPLLDKILYMADYIEPTRSFDGLDGLRRLAYEDLDAAMILGIRMTMQELAEKNAPVHSRTREALAWLTTGKNG